MEKFLGKGVNPDDVMLISMNYSYGNKETDWTDSLEIVYRDLKTNEKKLKIIKKPEVDIYFTKDEYKNYDYTKTDIELEKTDKVSTPIKNINWTIAKHAGPQYVDSMKQLVQTGNRKDMNKIQMYPFVFGSDMDCESYYRVQWLLDYDNEKPKKLTKAYFDIEVDGIHVSGFPTPDVCPINIVSIVNDDNKTVYTLLLNNPDNPSMVEALKDIDGIIEEAHNEFDEVYGKLNYQIYLYDDERDLIKAFFNIIHALKPDFLMGWNIFGFDVPYIMERCNVLGLDALELATHPDFFNRTAKFVKDTRNFDIKNKSDRFEVASYTKWIDHMRLYAATRKGRSELSSFNLNYVGRLELNDEKIDYSEEANIKTLPYVNYRRFVLYNIKDILLEYGIEEKTNDLDNLYLRSYSNCTTYDKVFKQTYMLKRRAYYEYLLQGNILGNNVNVFNVEEISFTGALVGNPLLNSHTGIIIFGKHSMYVFDDVIDMDEISPYIR